MATYHLNFRKVSKAKGQSAKAKSDYINREDKYSARFDDLRIFGSGNMPSFAIESPERFWEYADIYERANARVCTEVVFALPRELNLEQQQELVSTFIEKTISNENHNLPYSFAIHNDSENHNPHCHLIFSERHNDKIERTAEQFFKRANSKNPELGGAKKSTHANSKEFVQEVRTTWRQLANEHLAKNGYAARIDERSYQDQGLEQQARARLDRVTWQELKHLEQKAQNLGREIEKLHGNIQAEKRNEEIIAKGVEYMERKIFGSFSENTSKSSIEQLLQKDDVKYKKQEKTPENRKEELSQEDFDSFLIENWLPITMESSKNTKELEKFETAFKNCVSDLDRIQTEYNKADEKNQGFLGLWETKEQKQRKKELADEFEKVAKLRNTARENYKELKEKLDKFKQDKIDPVLKRIEEIQAKNPHLKMRNETQLNSMKLKGIAVWHKESQQRKLEWEKVSQKRQQEREMERKSGLSL